MLVRGALARYIGVAPDFLVEKDPSSDRTKIYAILPSGFCTDISILLRKGDVVISSESIGIKSLCSFVAPPYGCSWCSLEDAARDVEAFVRPIIERRNVLLCYSGGKDSTLALLLLNHLLDRFDFKLRLVYVYVPLLDDPNNPRIAATLASRLGFDLEVIEAKRRDVKSYMRWRGLPRLGNRWCTQFKTRPIKRLAKQLDAVVVVADRATESPKRCRKLFRAIASSTAAHARIRKLYLIAKATLIDVIKIVSEHGLTHPLYLRGVTRVSCALCPFKSIYEYIVAKQSIEDEGLVLSVLKREYRKAYSRFVPEDTFLRCLLWRFSPQRAKAIYKLQSFVSKYFAAETRSIPFDEVRSSLSRLWRGLGATPRVNLVSVRDLCSTLGS